ncbi:hypothetical protein [Paenibacillus sp. USHLN196]|uniref:hypothetical protein n=1 Tax=Paenibacillus sp. USHLN196 TaxID=3081291 RepID=UPI003016BDE8
MQPTKPAGRIEAELKLIIWMMRLIGILWTEGLRTIVMGTFPRMTIKEKGKSTTQKK